MVHPGSVHHARLLIPNWTDGDADKLVTYNVHNRLGAWRKLYRIEFPGIEHHATQLTDDSTGIKAPTSITDMKTKI